MFRSVFNNKIDKRISTGVLWAVVFTRSLKNSGRPLKYDAPVCCARLLHATRTCSGVGPTPSEHSVVYGKNIICKN